MRLQNSAKSCLNSGSLAFLCMGAKLRPFCQTFISISVRTLLLRLTKIHCVETKIARNRVALILTDLSSGKLWSDICHSFNDPQREKFCFIQISKKNGGLAASNLFHMFAQSVIFYTFYYHILRVQMFEKCDSSNIQ